MFFPLLLLEGPVKTTNEGREGRRGAGTVHQDGNTLWTQGERRGTTLTVHPNGRDSSRRRKARGKKRFSRVVWGEEREYVCKKRLKYS